MGLLNRLHRLMYIDSFFESKLQILEYENYVCNLNASALNSERGGVSTEKYAKENIIVSLTTYGERLYEVYLAIESIMQQTLLPNKIILWLSEDLKEKRLPMILQRQQKRGLEIEYCEDMRSYKKLIPALAKYPDDVIITIDDDLLFRFDMVEKLVNAYLDNPSYIYCNRVHRMKLAPNGKIDKFSNWDFEVSDYKVSPFHFYTTGTGVLFPPHCFKKEILNKDVFMKICETADDVWVNAMSLYSGILCKRVYTHNVKGWECLSNENVQGIGLYNKNKYMNDKQIEAVYTKYDLYNHLARF